MTLEMALTFGVYDLFHVGHATRIRNADGEAGYLIVGVQSDTAVEATKGRPPVWDQDKRVAAVESLDVAQETIVYTDACQLVKDLSPDVLVLGADFFIENDRRDVLQVVHDRDIRVVLMPRTRGVSTTELRKQLLYDQA